MTVFMVPPFDAEDWPSLGPQVVSFIEALLRHGPGDLLGQRVQLDAEKRSLIRRLYEVYPKGHPQAGRRRFQEAALMLRKGVAKTELGAFIAACELHQDGPVRFDGWDGRGNPLGRGVVDPYIPMVAATAQQSSELAFNTLYQVLSHSDIVRDFDLGKARIMRARGDGTAIALATAPSARDGSRVTFQLFDESHRLTSQRQREAHETMCANLPKRYLADAWSLEITTAYGPGEGSVAEARHEEAQAIADGRSTRSNVFFFYRYAPDLKDNGEPFDLAKREDVKAAVLEASGQAAAAWTNVDAIVNAFDTHDPTKVPFLERVFLNRIVRPTGRAFDAVAWGNLARPQEPPQRAWIVLGFYGSRAEGAALVATEVATGYQWMVKAWEKPHHPNAAAGWEVKDPEVDDQAEALFKRFRVWRLYADPMTWETLLATWMGRYSTEKDQRIRAWPVRRPTMALVVRAYTNAQTEGALSHDGDPVFARHIGNAFRLEVPSVRDERDMALWRLQKERPDSPKRIDAAQAGALSWQCRTDALAEGIGQKKESCYDRRAREGEDVLRFI